jgi:hypothetical protein
VLERFLPDYRRGLERLTLDRLTKGGMTMTAIEEARGYLLSFEMIEKLTLDQVRNWYQIDEYIEAQRAKRRRV